MTTKVIYFTVGGKPEKAEFRDDFAADDVKGPQNEASKLTNIVSLNLGGTRCPTPCSCLTIDSKIDLFRAAAEAGPYDILKLYNSKGSIVNISPKLVANTADTSYKLEVVAAHCSGNVAAQLGFDIGALESRISALEQKVLVEGGETPSIVYDMRNKVEQFREKLESVEHLSWLGLFKDISAGTTLHTFWDKKSSHRKSMEHNQKVFEKFQKMSYVAISEDVKAHLRKPTFDNWQWEDAEMLVLLQQMYIDFEFTTKFNIELPALQQFLYEVYKNYNQIPFHNFRHCFCVSQMMYGLSWLTNLTERLGDLDVMIMLTSAICHDLDHPGYNNSYQVNARTELALRYNDISPLENHHCAVAFEILAKKHCNIFRNLPHETYRKVREGMIRCILATDMGRHNEILNKFKAIMNDGFDFTNKEHKDVLSMILIKVSDISNEARPMDVAEPWLDCLLKEFFNQSDVEKLEGLPVAPFMDREKVSKPSSQVGFIRFVLLPLFETLASLFPQLKPHILTPVCDALDYYTELENSMCEEQNKTANGDIVRKSSKCTPNEVEGACGLTAGVNPSLS